MRTFWGWLVIHRIDILWAAAIGIVCAVIFAPIGALLYEMLPSNSRTRILVRRVQNRLAERSAVKLKKRIAALKQYRDSFITDKAHYLSMLRFILAILLLMTMGVSLFAVSRIEQLARFMGSGSFDLLGLMCFGLAMLLAAYAMTIASLDTQGKIQARIASIDADINELISKLPPV